MPERGRLAVATLVCATFAAWVAGSAVPAQDFRPLVVLHAAAAPIDLAYVNTVIGKMNTVIQAAGPCSNIRFYRGAAPAVSAEVPATISTTSQMQRLFNDDAANVWVPRFVSYCGTPDAGYAGCSSREKNAVVEYYPNTDLTALLWLHEIGHSHRLSHVSDSTRLMNPVVGIGRQKIIDSECAEYLAGSDSFPIFEAAVVDPDDLVANEGLGTAVAGDQVALLKAILGGAWAGGTAEATKALDPLAAGMPDFLQVIRQVLMNDAEIALWPNAVLALGLYGDESDIPFLEAFLLRQHPPSDYAVQSLANVPFAIGYLSGQHASTRGLEILEEGTEVDKARTLVARSGADPEVASALAEAFALESLVALARVQGEVSRKADRGEASEETRQRVADTFNGLNDRIGRGDATLPLDEADRADFLAMLDQLREDVQRLGLDAYVRQPQQ